MKTKREPISKRTRFEVFKRDQFKCQYCGAAAPEVLLTIDHIKPVAKGGGRDVLNLITACHICNSGKADVPLSDSTAVAKQMKQVRLLAERREQMKMLVKWRDGFRSLEDEKVKILVDRINARLHALFAESLNEVGLETVRGWVRKFGMDSSLSGIDQASNTNSAASLFGQMKQYAATACKIAKEPELRDFYRIRAKLKAKGLRFRPEWAPIRDMRIAFKRGVTIEDIDGAADMPANRYDDFLQRIEIYLPPTNHQGAQ